MPVWLEILLNVMAFVGFIGIAKYHKAPGGKLPGDRAEDWGLEENYGLVSSPLRGSPAVLGPAGRP